MKPMISIAALSALTILLAACATSGSAGTIPPGGATPEPSVAQGSPDLTPQPSTLPSGSPAPSADPSASPPPSHPFILEAVDLERRFLPAAIRLALPLPGLGVFLTRPPGGSPAEPPPPGFLVGGPNGQEMAFLSPDAPAKALLWDNPQPLRSGLPAHSMWRDPGTRPCPWSARTPGRSRRRHHRR